jgi:hypothetical protein
VSVCPATVFKVCEYALDVLRCGCEEIDGVERWLRCAWGHEGVDRCGDWISFRSERGCEGRVAGSHATRSERIVDVFVMTPQR